MKKKNEPTREFRPIFFFRCYLSFVLSYPGCQRACHVAVLLGLNFYKVKCQTEPRYVIEI